MISSLQDEGSAFVPMCRFAYRASCTKDMKLFCKRYLPKAAKLTTYPVTIETGTIIAY